MIVCNYYFRGQLWFADVQVRRSEGPISDPIPQADNVEPLNKVIIMAHGNNTEYMKKTKSLNCIYICDKTDLPYLDLFKYTDQHISLFNIYSRCQKFCHVLLFLLLFIY